MVAGLPKRETGVVCFVPALSALSFTFKFTLKSLRVFL
jgi:hypothetical protein